MELTRLRAGASTRARAERAGGQIMVDRKPLALDDLTHHRRREQSERILGARDDGVFQGVGGLASIEREPRHVQMLF